MNEGARVIPVIETNLLRRGDGRDTLLRIVRQYWDFEGNLLAENDPCAGREGGDKVRHAKAPTREEVAQAIKDADL